MPIFKVADFNQIGVSFPKTASVIKVEHKNKVKLPQILSTGALKELSFNIEPPTMDLANSPNKWGLNLKSITLNESFEGFIANLFNPINEIFFTSIAWDYSGTPPIVYPPKGAQGSNFIIPIKSKTNRKFIGDGVNLWPSRKVVGALNLVVLIYECDSDIRKYGETLVEIHDTVKSSNLTALTNSIATLINPSWAVVSVIESLVNEVLGLIGNIMKRNSDDYVDLFEGSYGTDKIQTAKIEKYDQEAVGIELELTVS